MSKIRTCRIRYEARVKHYINGLRCSYFPQAGEYRW